MPNTKDDFYDYDHLRFLSGRGLYDRLGTTNKGLAKNLTTPKHEAHQFTSYYFDFSSNYTGLWGKYICTWGNASKKSYRQIDTNDYYAILKKFPRGASMPSNFAINIPGGDGKHVNSAGLLFTPSPNDDKITEAMFATSKEYKIQPLPNQISQITQLYNNAVNLKTEQSLYIVLDQQAPKLEFVAPLASDIIKSTSTEVSTKLENIHGKITHLLPRLHTGSSLKQVIGTVHTHYLSSAIAGFKMGYGVSTKDIDDAKKNNFVNYVIDDKYIHKVDQKGYAQNKLTRTLDILIDCLKTFSEMY